MKVCTTAKRPCFLFMCDGGTSWHNSRGSWSENGALSSYGAQSCQDKIHASLSKEDKQPLKPNIPSCSLPTLEKTCLNVTFTTVMASDELAGNTSIKSMISSRLK